MRTFASNQQFYDHLDSVVRLLAEGGHGEVAAQIDDLLHGVAWTTSSELFGELKARFEAFLRSSMPKEPTLVAACREIISTIDRAWSRANGAR